jgi:hypothetical protein
MEGGIFMNHKNQLFNQSGHLTPFALDAIKKNKLSDSELLLATSHIADCLSCAKDFANSFATYELKKVPYGFAKEIESKLPSKTRKNKQLLFYSFRVGLAVCASLLMIFSSSLSFYANVDNYAEIIKPPKLSFIQSVNTGLKDFSQKILVMEVFPNETKER